MAALSSLNLAASAALLAPLTLGLPPAPALLLPAPLSPVCCSCCCCCLPALAPPARRGEPPCCSPLCPAALGESRTPAAAAAAGDLAPKPPGLPGPASPPAAAAAARGDCCIALVGEYATAALVRTRSTTSGQCAAGPAMLVTVRLRRQSCVTAAPPPALPATLGVLQGISLLGRSQR